MKAKTILILCIAIQTPFLSGQNVGVGTIQPQARLHIIAPNGFTTPLLKIEIDGNPSPHLIIQPDGKVGIGTSNPSQTLDVAGNLQFSGSLMPAGNAGVVGQVLVSQGPGNPPQWQSLGGAGGVAGLCSSPTANYLQKWTGSELCDALIYDNGTNVGIGTNTPANKLHIVGTGVILRLESPTHNGVWIRFQNQNSSVQGEYIGSVDSSLMFYTQNSPRITITADGKVGILNTTPSATLSIGGAVHIRSSGNVTFLESDILFSQRGGIAAQGDMYFFIDADSTSTDRAFYFRKDGETATGTVANTLMMINEAGNVGILTNNPTANLDINGNLRVRTIPNAPTPFTGSVVVSDNNGNIQGLTFPGDSTLVLRGNGTWGKVSSSRLCNISDVSPCIDASGNPASGACPTMPLTSCVNACRQATINGFNDWLLPSIDEMTCLRFHNYAFTDNATYWTRSPHSGSGAFTGAGFYFIFNTTNGSWAGVDDDTGQSCICIRH